MSEFVLGWLEIGKVYGVNRQAVQNWYTLGAPILLLGTKPVAELGRLWEWLLAQYGKEREPLGLSAAQAKTMFPDDGEKALVASVLTSGVH